MGPLDLNNRDIAALFWVGALLVLALALPQVRSGAPNILRGLLGWRILLPILLLAAWAAVWVYLGSLVGLWSGDLLKDTVVWYSVTGIGLLFSLNKALKDRMFWRRTARRLIEVNVLVAFLVNVDEVVFPLVVEFILQPVVAFLAGVAVVAHGSREYEPARGCITGLQVTVGGGVLVASVVRLITAWPGIDKHKLLLTFLVPVWLTLAAMPYIYVFVTLAAYELAFGRIDWVRGPRKGKRRAKIALVAEFRGGPHAVSDLRGTAWAFEAVNAADLRAARRALRKNRAGA